MGVVVTRMSPENDFWYGGVTALPNSALPKVLILAGNITAKLLSVKDFTSVTGKLLVKDSREILKRVPAAVGISLLKNAESVGARDIMPLIL